LLQSLANVAGAIASIVALLRANQAKATANDATHEAKEAAKEQITFALRDYVRLSSNSHLPAEEAGSNA
jgi:hypothetical protein